MTRGSESPEVRKVIQALRAAKPLRPEPLWHRVAYWILVPAGVIGVLWYFWFAPPWVYVAAAALWFGCAAAWHFYRQLRR